MYIAVTELFGLWTSETSNLILDSSIYITGFA